MIARSYILAGYAGALADVYRMSGDAVLVAGALRNAGLTLEQLRLADAAPEDLDELA